jgi:hypothetical protein
MKVRVLISMDEDVHERVKQYAFENHKSVSGAITDLILNAKVSNSQMRGQISLDQFKK